jgi:hypothetical protein
MFKIIIKKGRWNSNLQRQLLHLLAATLVISSLDFRFDLTSSYECIGVHHSIVLAGNNDPRDSQ